MPFENPKTIRPLIRKIASLLQDILESTAHPRILSSLIKTSIDTCTQLENILDSNLPKSDFVDQFNHLRSVISRVRDQLYRAESEQHKNIIDEAIEIAKTIENSNIFNEMVDDDKTILEYRISELNKNIINLEKDLESARQSIKSIETETVEKLKNIDEYAKETQSRLSQKESRINEIVGITTEKAIAGNYETTAEIESRNADRMRNYSLSFMLMMILVTSYTYYQSFYHTVNLSSSIIKLSIVIILSIPAGYLARESAKHRNQQHKYEQLSLHLKAASPYVEDLPEEIKNEIKIKIADQIFSQGTSRHNDEESFRLSTDFVLKKILEKVEKLPK